MTEIPKYCAVCGNVEDITPYGVGDTPDEAFDKLIFSAGFKHYCDYWSIKPDTDIEVRIHCVCSTEDPSWGDEANSQWGWCIDDKIETRVAKATTGD